MHCWHYSVLEIPAGQSLICTPTACAPKCLQGLQSNPVSIFLAQFKRKNQTHQSWRTGSWFSKFITSARALQAVRDQHTSPCSNLAGQCGVPLHHMHTAKYNARRVTRKFVLLQALIGTRVESQPGFPGLGNSNGGAKHSQQGSSTGTCKFCQTENTRLEQWELGT